MGYSAIQSQGWQELEDPSKFGIFLAGSHVFEEAGEDDRGKRTLKNQDRRKHRLSRRTYRRRVWRRDSLYALFASHNMLPADEAERDAILTKDTDHDRSVQPWALRARALDEAISLEEFAKAICHLNRSRGYLSTRDLMADEIPPEYRLQSQYADPDSEEEAGEVDSEEKLGVVLGGIKATYEELKIGNARTYGELMFKIGEQGNYTRHYTSRFNKTEKNKTPEPETRKLTFRSDRALIRAEFHRMFEVQAKFHPGALTKGLRQEIERIIFGQFPLQDTDGLRKTCPAYPSSYCAPKTSDAFQKNRILSDLFNSIQVGVKPKKSKKELEPVEVRNTLSAAQLNIILPILMDGKDLTLVEIVALTGLDEAEILVPKKSILVRRGHIFGHQTRRLMRELTDLGYDEWNDETKTRIQDIVNSAKWPNDTYHALCKLGVLDRAICAKIALAPFPDGYGEYSTKFLNRINDRMVETGEYHAVALVPLMAEVRQGRQAHVSEAELISDPDEENPSSLIKLPADLGLRNPIVERAIRRSIWVLNQIIYRYGIPEKIRVELPRDLTLSALKKNEIERAIADNEANRQRVKKKLEALGIDPTGIRVKKAILLEETDFILLYESKNASYHDLDELEIDHAYPQSRLYINDNRNLVLCTRSTNAAKGEQLLWEFLGDDFSKFQTRVKQSKRMGRGKQNWLCRDTEPEEEWLASQLAATGYIAREMTKLLTQLGVSVEITSGRATAHLRSVWGLNNLFPDWLGYAKHIKDGGAEADFKADPRTKNRSDHRHHAVDAVVVALTDVRTFQQISRVYRDRKPGEHKIDWHQTCPIKNLDGFMRDHVDDIVVTSHTIKKVSGALNEATAHREDLKKLDANLQIGAPKSIRVAGGKLIRYNRDGKAAQCYRLGNNHHLTIYKSLKPNKKGVFEFEAEITTMIEVAFRARRKEPVYQENPLIIRKGFAKWLTLEKGELVEFTDRPGVFYRTSALTVNPAFEARFQHVNVGTMHPGLYNRLHQSRVPILRLSSLFKATLIVRKVWVNAFGEVVHEEKPKQIP